MPPTEDTDGEALPMDLELETAAAPSEVPADEEEIAAKPAATATSTTRSSREPATNAPANREEATTATPAAAATPAPCPVSITGYLEYLTNTTTSGLLSLRKTKKSHSIHSLVKSGRPIQTSTNSW